MQNPSLRFVKIPKSIEGKWKVDDWKEIEHEMSPERTIIITPDNLPNKILYLDKKTGNTTAAEEAVWEKTDTANYNITRRIYQQ